MLFWIVTTALALAVAGLIALALLRGRASAEPPAAYDLRVYRDQLKEIDRDLARGVIDPADADRVRAEVSRRILAADTQLQAQAAGGARRGTGNAVIAGLVTVALVAGAALLYRALGTPGYADLPRQLRIDQADYVRQNRPDQMAAEAEMPPRAAADAPDPQYADLMDKLRDTVAARPDDLQGHVLLAQNEASLGNFDAAWHAQQEVIRIKGAGASAQDYAELAEMMILATGGYVSPEAENALAQALDKDQTLPVARYYWGLMLSQIGRPDGAFTIWDRLLRDSTPDAPWRGPIEAQMPDIARLAGVDYAPQPGMPALPGPAVSALPGPGQADIDAAASMSPEDRMDMVRAMVEGLETRLGDDGGTPQEWARLIAALGVLGDTDRARAALDAANSAYQGNTQALATIAAAATQAGLTQ
ncbi:MAG: c-type cytochrome biogenesis protein CcmI [Rhodobacteraceae bacterium]|nr:c-type cytochrome biogenesis protein CcmI [Paracoccaceae bacterium]MAY48030.1 c-type cytochrome biogenesis protein CcmI [Paracoccaceae bacterium]